MIEGVIEVIALFLEMRYNYQYNQRNNIIDFTFFQRKGLCNSGLKAKSTTFVRNITIIRLRSQIVISKIKIEIWQII